MKVNTIKKDRNIRDTSTLKITHSGIFILLFFALIVPYFYNFPHVYINAHDNLDIDVIRYMLNARKNYIFSDNDTIIPEMMGGLPRLVFDSEWYYPVWLFYFLNPYVAIILNMILVHLVAFISSFVLGKYVLNLSDLNKWEFSILIVYSLAFTYFQEQHLLNLGLSIALSPLLVLSFIRIYKKESIIFDKLIIILFPFVSRLIHVGIFCIFWLLVVNSIHFILHKKIHRAMLLWTIILTLLYIGVEYRLIKGLLIEHFETHRVEFNLQKMNLIQTLKKAGEYLWWGDYQARCLNFTIVFLFLFLFILIILKKIKIPVLDAVKMSVLIGVIFISAFIAAFAKYEHSRWILKHITFLDTSRFAFLLPAFSLLLIFVIIRVLLEHKISVIRYGIIFIGMISLLYVVKYNHTLKDFVKSILPIGKKEANNIHYFYLDEFYAADLFEDIKKILPPNVSEYRVGSIGIHPALALFNGFYTIDGAIANYPLAYKKIFRKIIEKEIEKNEQLKSYFDNYGCRVYLFSSELFNKDKPSYFSIQPQLNTTILKQLNCQYIFSSVPIRNPLLLKWELLSIHKNSNYTIYVYKIL